jgi:hypothetical protein
MVSQNAAAANEVSFVFTMAVALATAALMSITKPAFSSLFDRLLKLWLGLQLLKLLKLLLGLL